MTASDTIFRSLVGNAPPSQCVTLWFYPGAHVVHYPVGQPAKLNLVVATQGQKPAEHFQGACADLQTLLALATDWSQWPAAYVPPLKRWHKDNITLIGDAAHGTLPYLAQGAAMAIEDAASLLAALQKNQDPAIAFQNLSEMRNARTAKLHRATLQARRIYHAKNWIAGARDMTLAMLPANLAIDRIQWIYAYT